MTVPEFIAYAKANPRKINMASPGNGTMPHVSGELFKMMASIVMVHVPYRGGSQLITDLIAGQVQVGFLGIIRSGATRPVSTRRRRWRRFSPCSAIPW
jgi:tripartite-type tricarboxylate transporter receptor subunit TctC